MHDSGYPENTGTERVLSVPTEVTTTVATVLTPLERVRVDVAVRGAYSTLHRGSLDDVVDDLRQQRAAAVLVSASRYDLATTARMAAMVREFPRVPTFALLSDMYGSAPQSVHVLGQLGVRALVDVRQPSGWTTLRELLLEETTDVQRLILGALRQDLWGVSDDCWRFFELLFTCRPRIVSVRQIARALNVLPSTLLSRFYRAQLPSPKQYIAVGRLIRAAWLLENPGLSIARVARQLDYSSPQAFSRHVHGMCGISPLHFRQRYDGEAMLRMFRDTLILPYLPTLRRFRPSATTPGWVPKTIPSETLSLLGGGSGHLGGDLCCCGQGNDGVPRPFDLRPAPLFSVDQCQDADDSCPGGRYGFDRLERRPSAGNDVLHDRHPIGRVERSFDQFSGPVALRFLTDGKGTER